MESILGLLIPIISIVGFFVWMLAISPVGKAYAERLRAAPSSGDGGQRELAVVVEELRREVGELAERMDFTERLLAKERPESRLKPGGP